MGERESLFTAIEVFVLSREYEGAILKLSGNSSPFGVE